MRSFPMAAVQVLALALAAAVSAPAQAQQINPNGEGASGLGLNLMQGKRRDPEAEERQKKIDEEYQAVRRAIPEQKTSTDPWGNMRGNAPPAQAEKTSEKKKRQSTAR